MKHTWKRTMSLLLSGALLLGNVPAAAFAVEEEVIEVVQETQITQPVAAAAVIGEETVSLKINGAAYANGAVANASYADGVLTLNGAAGITGIEAEEALTIRLVGSNEIQAGDAVAILARKDLTITGEGSLKVVTANPTVLSVAGSGEGESKKGLVIDGAQVWVETTAAEDAVGIESANGVKIMGAAHVKASCAGTNAYTLPAGYAKTGDGDFAESESAWTADGSAFEFVSEEHLQYTATDTQHTLACRENCGMSATVLSGDHSQGQEGDRAAGCGQKAHCGKCGLDYGTEQLAHISGNTEFVKLDDASHKEVYVCCGADKENTDAQPHAPEYSAQGAVITAKCGSCGAEGSITLTAGGGVENGSPYEAALEKTGILNGTEATLSYQDSDGTVLEDAPQTYGKYTASVEAGGKTAAAEFYVTRDITSEEVKLDDAQLIYNGQAQTKTAVKADPDSDVTFQVENNVQTDAGTYKLTVKGTGCYSGTLELEYTIAQAESYTDATVAEQTIIGEEAVALPVFTGVTRQGEAAPEVVPGSCVYTFTYQEDTQSVGAEQIPGRIADLPDGDTATLNYIFTPAADGNYAGEKTGSIRIRMVRISFQMEDGSAVTADQVRKEGDITFGDTDMVDVSKLVAKTGGETGQLGEGFTVSYAKIVGGTPEEARTETPGAGAYRFYITYSGTLGGIAFADVPVCEGSLDIQTKDPSISEENKPKAEHLMENADGTALALIKAGNEGKTDDGAALEYSLSENGEYASEIPTVTEAGYYEVWYRTPHNGNYTTPGVKDKIQVLVVPYLTATYGQTLADVRSQLPEGFAFNAAAHPKDTDTVGNAGEQKVKLDYTHPNDDPENAEDYPTLTAHEAVMKVSPKKITPTMTLNSSKYDKDNDEYINYNGSNNSDVFVVKDGEVELVYGKDYKLDVNSVYSVNGFFSRHIVTKKEGGNYEFDVVKKEVRIYRPTHSSMTTENFPEAELAGTDYDSWTEVKTDLSKKVKEDNYPESLMKYFKVHMTRPENNKWVEHTGEDACPPNGFTYEIPYSALDKTTEKDNFQVAVLYLSGDQAGQVIELTGDALEKTDTGLEITLAREAAVCVALEVDLTEEYSIAKSIVYNDSSSSKGSLTFKVDSKSVTKATFGTTVNVTASASSGYSIKSVTFTAENGSKVESEKVSEGSYKFTMPASKVTVKLTLSKNSANPSSGDNSNIQLWLAVLGASVVGIAAVAVVWFRKRKK